MSLRLFWYFESSAFAPALRAAKAASLKVGIELIFVTSVSGRTSHESKATMRFPQMSRPRPCAAFFVPDRAIVTCPVTAQGL
jgi:hypothetical protein